MNINNLRSHSSRFFVLVWLVGVILLVTIIYFPGSVYGEAEATSTSGSSMETASATDTHTPQETASETPAEIPTGTDTPEFTNTALIEATPSLLYSNDDENKLSGEYIADQVVVKFAPILSTEIQRRYVSDVGASIILEIPELDMVVLHVPAGRVEESIAELQSSPDIVYVEPNYYAHSTDTYPNDPGWIEQYNLVAIHAPACWDWTTGALWVTIAILDTGVDLSHPELSTRILPGFDFVNNDSLAQDDNGHGTHVAAIAAASTNNGVGMAGVNWGASILPVKVLNSFGSGSYANVAAGIVWATDHGAQVINMSLGGASPSSILEDAVDYAYYHGVILVASTGNLGNGFVLYPAAYAPVIAVAATDSTNTRAGFSNYGPEVDVAAPGVMIYSAYPGGGYGYRSGTSMSAPHVSGLAALLRGIPGNTPGQVRMQIESTALDLGAPGWDMYYGFGLIQMDAAVRSAWPTPTPTTIPSSTFTNTPGSFPYPLVRKTLTPFSTLTSTYTRSLLGILSKTFTPDLHSLTNAEIAELTATITSQTTPQTREKPALFFLSSPCFGIVLIAAGMVLFWYVIFLKHRNQRRRVISKHLKKLIRGY